MADDDAPDDAPGRWWGEDTERLTTMVPKGFIEELAAAYPESRSETEAAWLAMYDSVQSKKKRWRRRVRRRAGVSLM